MVAGFRQDLERGEHHRLFLCVERAMQSFVQKPREVVKLFLLNLFLTLHITTYPVLFELLVVFLACICRTALGSSRVRVECTVLASSSRISRAFCRRDRLGSSRGCIVFGTLLSSV